MNRPQFMQSPGLSETERQRIIGRAFADMSPDPYQALIDTGELELKLMQADELAKRIRPVSETLARYNEEISKDIDASTIRILFRKTAHEAISPEEIAQAKAEMLVVGPEGDRYERSRFGHAFYESARQTVEGMGIDDISEWSQGGSYEEQVQILTQFANNFAEIFKTKLNPSKEE